jgi:hypothetical protein
MRPQTSLITLLALQGVLWGVTAWPDTAQQIVAVPAPVSIAGAPPSGTVVAVPFPVAPDPHNIPVSQPAPLQAGIVGRPGAAPLAKKGPDPVTFSPFSRPEPFVEGYVGGRRPPNRN